MIRTSSIAAAPSEAVLLAPGPVVAADVASSTTASMSKTITGVPTTAFSAAPTVGFAGSSAHEFTAAAASAADDHGLTSEERIAGLENLRRGLEVMAREGMIYADLHAGNVVVGGEDRLMRLIDCKLTKDRALALEGNLQGLAAMAQGEFPEDAAAFEWGEALRREHSSGVPP